jgi:hypothetical protein
MNAFTTYMTGARGRPYYQMFKTYWRQCQLLNEKGEVIPLSTENSHSTQQTELEAIAEEMSENDTPSENDSNTDEEAEEEDWQKAGKNQPRKR